MTDVIVLPTDRFTDSLLSFVSTNALAFCTSTGFDGGCRVVRADRPVTTFSTGEQNLWNLPRSLCSGEMRSLLEHADGVTLASVVDLFARVALSGFETGVGA